MKVLFVLKYYRDQASSRVRGFYVAEELEGRNIRPSILYGEGRKKYFSLYQKLINQNIIYFQKRYATEDLYINKLARVLGKRTFFDLDDAPGGVGLNPGTEIQAIKMMEASSAVVVGSHKLKEFAQNYNKNVYIMPSSINLNYYKPSRTKNSNYITLGWIGNGIGYKNDLQMLIEPLRKLGQEYNIRLIIVGALGQKEIHEEFRTLRSVEAEIIDSIEWADPAASPSAISNFDIGLYPLFNSEYNQYKCGYKALEYMAMRIPVVASPVGENSFIIEHGKEGFLVSNKNGWEEALSCLIKNEKLRKEMGELGRRKIEKSYSLNSYVDKLRKIFEIK